MDPATPGAETLALAARLTALTRELAPIRETYREWAREYEQTGIPRNRTEFSALVDRMKDVQDQLRDVRTALAAIAAGAETEQLRAELAELRKWPTTPAAREAWLERFAFLVIEGVDEIVARNPGTTSAFWAAERDLVYRRAMDRAKAAARNPDWPTPVDDSVGGAR